MTTILLIVVLVLWIMTMVIIKDKNHKLDVTQEYLNDLIMENDELNEKVNKYHFLLEEMTTKEKLRFYNRYYYHENKQ